MSKTKLLSAVLAGSFFMTGWASMSGTVDRLAEDTAAILNVKSSDITITNINNSYAASSYTAVLKSGTRHSCVIIGGVVTFGVTKTPQCTKIQTQATPFG